MPRLDRSPRTRALIAQGAPGRHEFGLALEVERLEGAVLDGVLGARVDGGPNDDLARFGRRLQACGSVHAVAGQHPVPRSGRAFEIDEDFASLHPDPHAKGRLALGGEAAVQLGQDRLHLEGGTDRPFCVVLVGPRDPEDGKHRVAHELLEGPS